LEKELNVKIKLLYIHLLPFEGKAFLKI